MRFSVKLIALSVCCVMAGCSSWNPFASKVDPKKQAAVLTEFKSTLNARALWTIAVGAAGSYTFAPAVDGSKIYAAANDGTVVKLDASGRTDWRINAGVKLTAGVGADESMLAVAAEKGFLLAFDNTGKALWKVQESSEILSTPVVGAGFVLVRSNDNRISAYDAVTGNKKWSLERPLPPLVLRAVPGLLIVGDQVLVALPGGHMIAVALKNGALRWEAVVGEPKGNTELERVADVSGVPVLVGRDVCATAYQGRVGCFDIATGTPRWVKNTSSEVGVGADERFVFAADAGGVVAAYARDGGASVWRNDKLLNRRLSAPISFGRSVAVGDYAGYVHFLSREDGSFIARLATDGSQILTAPQVQGSNLIVQTKSGSVVAFATE
ncbi:MULTISPECIES: outer membrane protein assembly factor BamB [unclassified Undibacterium]|uniref:outer membrane protein assembly factor BamB n=1 Tax=unclassified Undibacterium TaxID=2630295 RepID=UPI002AC978DD|nr:MULTISPECIES: outer membrane protein assembly factor BamB [unclassified Undibacterium]MEB0138364.1 outer membrane protein assembly factor BamB [Undibacterium sp. CCC2.1]MEB0172741.1 outer membrane protein assembly factor BamB [Undibacterium sp. CCC1.1]MEB0174739.1 outer membrane protein assembly factor BamB [Undibacterium sp. CCC3.4]MEB0213936.1 outer membrane protein assembly factor BamB [Undibacterium sp. 5I2]WPX42660.1 outer membrane protein assembly factor BamB [Undibacterium sp. CCC3.4